MAAAKKKKPGRKRPATKRRPSKKKAAKKKAAAPPKRPAHVGFRVDVDVEKDFPLADSPGKHAYLVKLACGGKTLQCGHVSARTAEDARKSAKRILRSTLK